MLGLILQMILRELIEFVYIPMGLVSERKQYLREIEAAVAFVFGAVLVLLCTVWIWTEVHGEWPWWLAAPAVLGFFFAGVLGMGWVATKFAASRFWFYAQEKPVGHIVEFTFYALEAVLCVLPEAAHPVNRDEGLAAAFILGVILALAGGCGLLWLMQGKISNWIALPMAVVACFAGIVAAAWIVTGFSSFKG